MYAKPVIYIFFNRPDLIRRTFSRIRDIKPRRLYLIADGPRPDRADDAGNCAAARAVVEDMIDWDCETTRDYASENLGCGRRLSSGLTAAFELLGEAVVLEDDVLPHPDFFPFCAAQLDLHRDNPRIHAVTGFNPLIRYQPSQGPAVPTIFNSIWGWASWQRSWTDYRFDLSAWKHPGTKQRIRRHVGSDLIYQRFAGQFDGMVRHGIDTWDYQWAFAMLARERYAVVSSVNLIENIGFGPGATHTVAPEPYLAGLHTHRVSTRPQQRPLERPDRLHDRLYAEVIMTDSRWKIIGARLAARAPFLRHLLKAA
jgi:hypothetical protein